MKHLPLLSLLLLSPTLATAHETGLAHSHPHTDWTALLALAVLVALGGLTLLRLRTAKARKDNHHDPR